MDRRKFLRRVGLIGGAGVASAAMIPVLGKFKPDSRWKYLTPSTASVSMVVNNIDPFDPDDFIGVTYLDYHIWHWTGWKGARDDDRLAGQWVAVRTDWQKNKDHPWNHIYQNCFGLGRGEVVTTFSPPEERDRCKWEGFERMLGMIEEYTDKMEVKKNG